MEFKKYRRKSISELRPVTKEDSLESLLTKKVSISKEDIENNKSPKVGDMIARNPENYSDQWLVEEKYFKENFVPYEGI